MERAVVTAGSKDFSLLSNRRLIPSETRAYVQAVLAASNLLGANTILGGREVVFENVAVVYASFAAGEEECLGNTRASNLLQ